MILYFKAEEKFSIGSISLILLHAIDKSSFIKHRSDLLRNGMIRVYDHLLVVLLRFGCSTIKNILKQLDLRID